MERGSKVLKVFHYVRDGSGAERKEGILEDGSKIAWVSYVDPYDTERKVIAVSPTIGCIGCCRFCLSRRRPFVRVLSAGEIMAQVLHCLEERRQTVNFACEGDAVLSNLDNSCEAVKSLCRMNLGFSFIVTTIGHEENLRRYLREYAKLPIKFYWSLNFLKSNLREYLMPGTKGSSLMGLRDVFEKIYQATGRVVTVSWVVMAGLNDTVRDVDRIAQFFGSHPGFEIKLMALENGSLARINTRAEDVEHFAQLLGETGIPYRIRRIVGGKIKAGCGTTVPI